MPITVRDITEVLNKDVFTDKGYYCGKITDLELDISRFKVRSIVITTAKGTFLGDMVGGKKGIIVPYPMVQSIGDVVVIKHITSPPPEEK
ncbi:MAG: PRC-barrel domain-containing protein [Candidatus Aenigmarchaeota archaeon]|nr:PRC-barrel domain-containing protein [Candidatus Aenigmarchaeota archaeon]